MGLDEPRYRGRTHRIQNAGRKQQHPERCISNRGAPHTRGEDGPYREQRADLLASSQQEISCKAIREQTGERADKEERKRSEYEPPEECEDGVLRAQVEQQYLCQTQRGHCIGHL